MKMNIPITKTIFGDEEKEAIVKPLETGWVVQGPNVSKFQTMFADFTKVNLLMQQVIVQQLYI